MVVIPPHPKKERQTLVESYVSLALGELSGLLYIDVCSVYKYIYIIQIHFKLETECHDISCFSDGTKIIYSYFCSLLGDTNLHIYIYSNAKIITLL